MQMFEHYKRQGLAAIFDASGLPTARPSPSVAADQQRRSDDETEAALAPRERAGTLLPSQAETLAEIRARGTAARPAPAPAIAAPIKSPPPPVAIIGSPPAQPAKPPVPNAVEGWKSEYAASQALQEEFGSEAKYLTYMEMSAKGRVHISGCKRRPF